MPSAYGTDRQIGENAYMGDSAKPEIGTNTLQGFKYMKKFLPLLERYHEIGNLKNRKLYFD